METNLRLDGSPAKVFSTKINYMLTEGCLLLGVSAVLTVMNEI